MKEKLINTCQNFEEKLKTLSDPLLLLIRLVLAYGFWGPAMMKWKNMGNIIEWFDGMDIPFPALNAYMAATTELLGAVLLILGLFTRLISIPLIFVMLVAIYTVHLSNGFDAGDNGFEIPLYYILMLLTLFVYGSGKISASFFIRRATFSKQLESK
jgi:putative oxidoreductase